MIKKFTAEEIAELKEISKKYRENLEKKQNKALEALSPDLKEFAEDIERYGSRYDTKLFKDLLSGLEAGTYKKPSEFILEKCEDLFKGWINPVYRDYVLYGVDKCCKWAFEQRSVYRKGISYPKYS